MKRLTLLFILAAQTASALTTITLDVSDTSEFAWNAALQSELGGERPHVRVDNLGGIADLVTGEYAVEVDRLDNYKCAIGQALFYADATEKTPCIALISDGSAHSYARADAISAWAARHDVEVWLLVPAHPTPATVTQPASEGQSTSDFIDEQRAQRLRNNLRNEQIRSGKTSPLYDPAHPASPYMD